MFTNLSDTGRIVHNRLHINFPRKLILFFLVETRLVSHCIKLSVQFVLINMEFYWNGLKVQRQRCASLMESEKE